MESLIRIGIGLSIGVGVIASLGAIIKYAPQTASTPQTKPNFEKNKDEIHYATIGNIAVRRERLISDKQMRYRTKELNKLVDYNNAVCKNQENRDCDVFTASLKGKIEEIIKAK